MQNKDFLSKMVLFPAFLTLFSREELSQDPTIRLLINEIFWDLSRCHLQEIFAISSISKFNVNI